MVTECTFVLGDNEKDKYPGMNTKEISCHDHNHYNLALIPNWRRILCNDYTFEVSIDGVEYTSVTHYIESHKMYSDKHQCMTLEQCATFLSTMTPNKMRRYTHSLDTSGYVQSVYLLKGMMAKFTYPSLPANVLHMTGYCRLVVYDKDGKVSLMSKILMHIRDSIDV